MLLIRKAYRGHYIEIRAEQTGPSGMAARQAQVWLDGEAVAAPRPCRDSLDLDHLLDEARSRIDALHI